MRRSFAALAAAPVNSRALTGPATGPVIGFVTALVAAALVVAGGVTAPQGATAAAAPGEPLRGSVGTAAASNPEPEGRRVATAALGSAAALLSDRGDGGAEDPTTVRGRPAGEATLTLRTLRLSYGALSRSEREQADRLLARPVRSARLCATRVCVHFATAGGDAATRSWAQSTLSTMERVWTHHVQTRGYRPPASDAGRGGTRQFDVYLENLRDNGLYGYCSTEGQVPNQPLRYASYCVLDNDYRNYPLAAGPTLRVTAAHEFLHAIQFNYDAAEDSWVMEATATWIEELYADDVNDNRSFLSSSQISNPSRPLDLSSGAGASPAWYGNWVFFQRFAQRLGPGAVRTLWGRLDATTGRPDEYSIQGVRNVLAARAVGMPRFYSEFAAGNAFPGRSYSEGSSYPSSPMASNQFLGAQSTTASGSTRLNHLTYQNRSLYPTATLTGSWRLQIRVNGPWIEGGPAAYVSIPFRDGTLRRAPIRLDRFGDGQITVNFTRAEMYRVVLTMANASKRYSCFRGGAYSCAGVSSDDNLPFSYTVTAIPG